MWIRGAVLLLQRGAEVWGGSPSKREKLAELRAEKESEVERLFQYVVRSLKAKVNFKGIVEAFEKKLGSHDKAVKLRTQC